MTAAICLATLAVGACLGALVMAACCAAGRSDREAAWQRRCQQLREALAYEQARTDWLRERLARREPTDWRVYYG